MSTVNLAFEESGAKIDMVRNGGNIEMTDGLGPAVMLSLFTNRHALENEIPKEEDQGGWWGDAFTEHEGDQEGSRLWVQLRNGKMSQDFINETEEIALEALQWLIDDGVADSITVDVFASRRDGMPRDDMAGIHVKVYRGNKAAPAYESTWEVSLGL